MCCQCVIVSDEILTGLIVSDEILSGATKFFKEELAPKLAPLSASLTIPGRYVIDLYFDSARGNCHDLN